MLVLLPVILSIHSWGLSLCRIPFQIRLPFGLDGLRVPYFPFFLFCFFFLFFFNLVRHSPFFFFLSYLPPLDLPFLMLIRCF